MYLYSVFDGVFVPVQLDTLEYIHEHEYVHADVKASNLMLSHSDPNQVSWSSSVLTETMTVYKVPLWPVHRQEEEPGFGWNTLAPLH